MKLDDIYFGPRISLEQHQRYLEFHRLIGLRDFAGYREVFERGWAEISIMCGQNVRVDHLAVTPEPSPNSPLANLMGVDDHSPRRVQLAKEFFDGYERFGRAKFLREVAMTTGYVRNMQAVAHQRTIGLTNIRALIAKQRLKRELQYRINSYLNVYENMKQFERLVGKAHTIREVPLPVDATDIPWAIDYYGHIKLRDGAHRRAIAYALGWETVPTIVFQFDGVTKEDLESAHPYIRDNFDWFAKLVWETARLT